MVETPNPSSNTVLTTIQRQAVDYIVKVVIATAAGIIGLAALGLWIYVKQFLPGVPPEAVMAFDLQECPPGWSLFNDARGRVVIGQGKGEDLTNRPFRRPGGLESYPLTELNIPYHQHVTVLGDGLEKGEFGRKLLPLVIPGTGKTDPNNYGANTGPYGKPKGEQEDVPTMPPYIPLTYCKKDR
jgi:hypothetical protein